MNNIRIERIELDRINEFLSIIREIAIWLKDQGKEMWTLNKVNEAHFLNRFKDGEWYICYSGNEPAGVFILLKENKRWWTDQPKGESLFLKKLGVRRKYAGTGISTYIINWIKSEVKKRNMRYIRLEIFADVEFLDAFYKKNRFRLVKEVVSPRNNKRIGLYELKVI
ncbi:GNAT family N-acetyltransferase [Haloplasma contractile]|uniref:N-acetyltransferase GCN5 protein n=1 Tax=Haloplasma contractile SSD-17B TaxID=1033810 RepID=U2DSN2_9MOLU|nr:GNAT family N-acetyltransferase [Haloplasma contractile]ERJ11507.1 N-acetyltransferase GCN5 protein [Haloplasma contractile SSD-17B]